DLKTRGEIDSIHGKNYFVASRTHNILLLLDEYSPFKEVLYNTIASKLPPTYKIDLLFHQYNKYLFDKLINESNGKYNKYLVMNYDNDKFSDSLLKIDKKKLLLLDFGNFEKDGYSYVCQDFEQGLYDNLLSIKNELSKYNKLIFVLNRRHKHPPSSKLAFSQFCLDHNFEFEVVDEISEKTDILKNHFYLAIKNEDIVEIIKQGQSKMFQMGEDYGLLAYNENPFYEIVGEGISSIGIDWRKMGEIAAEFVIKDKDVQTYLPTKITKRYSF
ncbi:MAG: GntR family transcriptional regulator, partial [Dysgonamonadaceae bacterium]|nr:GntR family transcriptional regulator [Dysgonamonadaceae bacterium]